MKTLRLTFLFVLLLFTADQLRSQPVVVNGKAHGAAGYTVRLIVPMDLVSMEEVTLASAIASDDGSFRLEAVTDRVRYGYLDIEMQRAEIYLVPGETLKLETEFRPSQGSAFYDQEPLPLSILSDGMNKDIRELNEYYNHFILNHFEEIYRGRKKSLVDTLAIHISEMFPSPSTEYFRNYMKYKLAAAEQFSGRMSRQSLAEKYLLGEPVLYDHIEYNYFFNEFFEKYLLTGSKAVNVAMVMQMLEDGSSPETFIDSITRDPLLSDPRLAEYFLLSSLKELYFIPGFKREDVTRTLEQMGSESRFERHRRIASNILVKLNRLAKGQPAPSFELPSLKGKKVTLESLAGKYVYLFFFRTDNPVSIHEMDILQEDLDQFAPYVEVVGISADRDISALNDLARKKEYDFMLLHYDGDIELLEDYEARTFPSFMLLDKEGKILRYPAPWPGEDAVDLLMGL